jgi:hypothetical protein
MKIGQSGTRIEVVTINGNIRAVRKSAVDEADRLSRQYAKHQLALSHPSCTLRVPRILSDFSGGSYDMEYLQGIPLGLFLETASIEDTQLLAKKLSSHLTQLLVNSEKIEANEGGYSEANSVLEKKLLSLKKILGTRAIGFKPFLDLLELVLNDIQGLEVPFGWNHGDFSFENILVIDEGAELALVDFLNSPFDTPLIDVGRFLLDATYGWWGAGFVPSANWSLNTQMVCKSATNSLGEVGVLPRAQRAFIGLALLRVVPYTERPTRMSFLKSAAYKILQEA